MGNKGWSAYKNSVTGILLIRGKPAAALTLRRLDVRLKQGVKVILKVVYRYSFIDTYIQYIYDVISRTVAIWSSSPLYPVMVSNGPYHHNSRREVCSTLSGAYSCRQARFYASCLKQTSPRLPPIFSCSAQIIHDTSDPRLFLALISLVSTFFRSPFNEPCAVFRFAVSKMATVANCYVWS